MGIRQPRNIAVAEDSEVLRICPGERPPAGATAQYRGLRTLSAVAFGKSHPN